MVKRTAQDRHEFIELEKKSIEVACRISDIGKAALDEKLPTKALDKTKKIYDNYLADVEATIQSQITRIKEKAGFKQFFNESYHDLCQGTPKKPDPWSDFPNPWGPKTSQVQRLYEEMLRAKREEGRRAAYTAKIVYDSQCTDARERSKRLTFLEKARDAVYWVFKKL